VRLLTVDLQFFAGEKTEKATPKRREEAKKKGQVAKSQEVITAINLLAVFSSLYFASSFLGDIVRRLFSRSFQDYMLMPITEGNLKSIVLDVMKDFAYMVGPFLLVALVGSLAANYLQVGFLFTTETLVPKLEKIDPMKGFQRIFSIKALVELLKSILKVSIVGTVTFVILWMNMDRVLGLSFESLSDSLKTVGTLTVQMGISASIALLFLALFDYLYQKYDFEKSIRMSKQDIKDEYKNSEGDPQIKSRIKQRQREMAMRRMMQEVPNADVVITNPTHFAVALKYEEEKMDAPVVVAKGADYLAQKIKAIAKENHVETVENRPLARALYTQVEIGERIPEEFFKAVAEILAYVYRLKNKV
jgi:flagellar biosynthetic protein FlhB